MKKGVIKTKLQRQDKTAYQAASYFDTIRLKDENGDPALLPSGAIIIFGIKSYPGGEYVIRKVLDENDEIDGGYPIHITPEEMDIAPMQYYYDASVQTAGGDLIKIIPQSVFKIVSSITRKENE